MTNNFKSNLAMTIFGSGVGFSLLIFDIIQVCFPRLEKLSDIPLYIVFLLFVGITALLIGLVLCCIYKTSETTTMKEYPVEIISSILGLSFMGVVSIIKESPVKNILLNFCFIIFLTCNSLIIPTSIGLIKRIKENSNKNKKVSFSIIITVISAFFTSFIICLIDSISSESKTCPDYLIILLLCGIVFFTFGLVLCIIFRNRSNTSPLEFLFEGLASYIGLIGILISIDNNKLDFLFNLSLGLYFAAKIMLIPTFIGIIKKDKTKTKVNDNINPEVNQVYIDMCIHIDEKSNYGSNFDILTEQEKNIFIVTSFINEVYNGGFEKYMLDPSGEYYNLLIDSLKNIKLQQVLDIYKPIFNIIPNNLPKDENERDQILFEIFTDHIIKKIEKCDQKFYNINELQLQEIIYNNIKENNMI